MPDDRLAAKLDEIQARNEAYIETQRLTEWTVSTHPCGDVRRLHAVAVSALELADDWVRKSQGLDAAAEYAAAEAPDAPGAGLKHARSIAYDECAGNLEKAISAALLGEEAGRAP